MLRRLLNLPKIAKNRLDIYRHRARVQRESVSPALLAFWRNHGREWAAEEASPADLNTLSELSARISNLAGEEKRERATEAFRQIWASGFSNPAEAFPWNGMNEDLPIEAMIAFTEGALSAKAK